ncbi:GTP-binding protein Rho1 [Rhizophlyctis rosea]|nr:GTP-binding protein Rho1 [Rhizophlyctis rosea]
MIGKTALLLVYSGAAFPQMHYPTVADSYITPHHVDSSKQLELVDTPGSEDLDRLRPFSYHGAQLVLLCFAITDPRSLINVEDKWLPEARVFAPSAPVLLVGLKKDLRTDRLTIEMLRRNNLNPVTQAQAQEAAIRMEAIGYRECSARTGEGVEAVFDFVIGDEGGIVAGEVGEEELEMSSPTTSIADEEDGDYGEDGEGSFAQSPRSSHLEDVEEEDEEEDDHDGNGNIRDVGRRASRKSLAASMATTMTATTVTTVTSISSVYDDDVVDEVDQIAHGIGDGQSSGVEEGGADEVAVDGIDGEDGTMDAASEGSARSRTPVFVGEEGKADIGTEYGGSESDSIKGAPGGEGTGAISGSVRQRPSEYADVDETTISDEKDRHRESSDGAYEMAVLHDLRRGSGSNEEDGGDKDGGQGKDREEETFVLEADVNEHGEKTGIKDGGSIGREEGMDYEKGDGALNIESVAQEKPIIETLGDDREMKGEDHAVETSEPVPEVPIRRGSVGSLSIAASSLRNVKRDGSLLRKRGSDGTLKRALDNRGPTMTTDGVGRAKVSGNGGGVTKKGPEDGAGGGCCMIL